jgi:hypothetical protein
VTSGSTVYLCSSSCVRVLQICRWEVYEDSRHQGAVYCEFVGLVEAGSRQKAPSDLRTPKVPVSSTSTWISLGTASLVALEP